MTVDKNSVAIPEGAIAITGMAAHLPGAPDVATYWTNLRDGIESIRKLSVEELLANGESPARIRQPNYVPAASVLEGFERFDPEFFGLSLKEAAIMDPQHRQFLECAWEALEDAGHVPENFGGPIGVFAGCGMGSYFYFNICSNPDLVRNTGMFLLRHTGNDKDFLSTRVSHIFDLKGPSLSIQTACSTSLVAVHQASQSLLNGECDMALAGGVTIELPHARGYLFEEGEILSPDGHCHAFDHRAQGTVFGSGAGCVVLRRLEDAIADGDHVWAVLRGTAVNNDGAAKAGYLAPSVEGQAKAVAEAHGVAGVSADTIGYVECHGTGTYLGDPIEVAALTQAFNETTQETGFCGIGSVKTNIGHTDTAAGVASLIKVSMALHHGQIPPSLGYEAPNPAIDFDGSPFRVNDRLSDFPRLKGAPRRAGVNSLGVGGTNAHAVVEEAPERAASQESDWPFQLLVLSARNKPALDEASRNLAAHLRAHPEQPLADVAWTLKQGRRAFEHRRVLVATSHEDAAAKLEAGDRFSIFTHQALPERPELVFMFPGGGAQYAGMARDLYETEPVFREWMDKGLDHLAPRLDYDLRALWLPEAGAEGEAAERLKRPSVQLPLIMITEYALAQLWISWGAQPAALIGHSMGENTAACLAGVIGFEDCIGLVHLRGQLMDTIAPGGMLSVPLSAEALQAYWADDLDMASVNAPDLCVVSGPQSALDALQARLAADEIEAQRIQIDIAAHSRMLEPILSRFGDYLRGITLNAPRLPVISNRTGQPLTTDQATSPDYWVAHLRNSVMFADGIAHLAQHKCRVYLEVGPGRALASLAQANGVPANQVLASLRHPDHDVPDDEWFIATLGRLWALGADVDWTPIWGEARRNRVPLPTYPFQRQSYFIEPGRAVAQPEEQLIERVEGVENWGWQPHWRPRAADAEVEADELDRAEPRTWLVFADEAGLAARAIARLRGAGHRVIEVRAGDIFAKTGEDSFTISPERGREDYDRLIHELVASGLAPQRIAHFWLVTAGETFRPGSSFFHRNQEQGFYSLMFLAQAMAEENLPRPIHLLALTNGAAQTRDEALPYPEKATVAGPLRVMPRELPGVTCASLDLTLPEGRRVDAAWEALADRVIEEMLAHPANLSAALRGDRRYELGWRQLPLETAEPALPQGAVCLLTGGFGGIGLTVGERLARDLGAKLVLVGRRALPDPSQWDALLRNAAPNDATAARIRGVRRLEAAGAEVLCLTADVCNLQDMSAARDRAIARFGRIDAVIHAAGVVDDAPILAKTPASVENVFAPKVHGTEVLDEVFPDGSVGRIVVFSSTSTAIAPAGQIDYVAANEFLNAWARSRAGGKTQVTAVNWGIWAEVGMAAEAFATPAPAPVTDVDAPLLDKATFDAEGNRVFTTGLTTRRWILDGHRTKDGQALIPGTGYLDVIAQALRAHGETGPFEIRDLFFFRPLAVDDDAAREMRLSLARNDEGYGVQIRSDAVADGRKGYELNAQAQIGFDVPAADAIDLAAISDRCGDNVETDPGGLRSPQEQHLNFGPRWRVLRRRAYGRGEGLAELALPDAFRAEPAQGWPIHPALMDLATGWAMGLIEGYAPDHLWVPVSYGSVRVHAPLAGEIRSWVRNAGDNRADNPFARFDVTLSDPDGRVLIEISGFTIHRLDGALDFAAASGRRDVIFPDAKPENRKLSPAEERLQHNLSQGIRPEEGAEGFLRALATGSSQVAVSSMPLPKLIEQAGQGSEEVEERQGFERPQLDSDYVEPRNGIERTLVGFWQELLGVGQVGVEDSFFDLGGHSLIAVRLFAMIRKTYSVDFPISVLFEAPTIAACAALIEDRIGPQEGEGAEAPKPRAPARRFTHLVPMHQGEGGPRRPFFLVAGMFGNVLNLRHLAQLLGGDRPFYGMQARGLFGEDQPHDNFVDAAKDYIAELKQVQPHGPYLLGGFSGGGLIAWEMARQLEAEGEEVALTVLLDTPLPMRPALTRQDKALIKLAELRRKGPGYLREWMQARADWKRQQRERAGAAPESAGQFHNTAIEAAFRAALPGYDMQKRDGRVVLFRPPLDLHWKVSGGRWVSAAKEYVYPDNDLTRFAPALQVIEVPGDHDSMVLEPNVRVMAARMREVITEAETGLDRPLAQAAE
ncbi:type I polyketide synthase [Paracoccus siganidrum]|uniref:SDR family NAD(P)-dependent oxidoreductase n=1 Tax=Paracoccus siganidrum TaxID=1276757 RepID=A0A419A940_9RHOB|nr:type I polyketide synthase [Paracoccus siganidrum]RJL18567.1 SDR family NAD(P)-dependent oxidoreductase [Paracoccus siganidrum]RMC36793.1 polyketide synthase [Paracoccus siganidrum]